MGYTGSNVSIPLGQLGLHTDDPMNQLPPNAAIVANNISLFTSRIEKSYGSQPYKAMAALSASVVGVFDWLPTPSTQRLIAVTSDGKIWRDTGDGTFGTATPIHTGLGTLDSSTHLVAGGAEQATRNKKLFVFTNGGNQIQVLSGDGSSTAAIAYPSVDWTSSNYPTFGFIYNGRHFVLGISSNRHTLYWSGAALATLTTPNAITLDGSTAVLTGFTSTSGVQIGATAVLGTTASGSPNLGTGTTVASKTATTITMNHVTTGAGTAPVTFTNVYTGQDHENFEVPFTNSGASSAGFQTIFSGEADGLMSAVVYKGTALLFKRPFGVYTINFTDTITYSVSKYSNSFGIASPHAVCGVIDDLMAGNNAGSITSLKATLATGAFETGDVLNSARVRDHVRQNTFAGGLPLMHSCYYAEKEVALFSTQSDSSAATNNRLIVVDVSRPGSTRISMETKDNTLCLGLRKDGNNILRPIYGSSDGIVYLMDQSDHSVNGTAYIGEFQTPYIDFSYLDASLADKNKIFDFLTVSFIAVGNWSFLVDVYVANTFVETLTFASPSSGSVLGSFILDSSRLGTLLPYTNRQPMHCTGKSISFRIYNSVASQFFRVDKLIVSFRLSAEQNVSSKG